MKEGRTQRTLCFSSRLDLPLLIEGQLFWQEQNLRAQGCARAEQETEEKKYVPGQISDQIKQRIQSALCVRKESRHGCQDRTRSVRLRSVFCQAGLASRVF